MQFSKLAILVLHLNLKNMKKNLLILALSISAFIAKAQFIEPTTYRGAFAPAPTKMWTDNWTNWDPQNVAYPTPTVTVTGKITTNTTWTSNNTYLISDIVYVSNGATLTIEPGTVIRGDENVPRSSLLVARGGKLIAEGTACNPIVFTSNFPVGSRAKAQWGGVILLGKARHNLNTGSGILIEGLANTDPENFHGGTDDDDNSGSLKYVRIEYGGYIFSPNNEINGLTFGSVGRGTTIDYIQCSFVDDDAFEWFGGSVNCKHLVAYRCLDDNFDTDNGFSGLVQFCLGVRDPAIADNPNAPVNSTSEGFESDNDNPGTNLGLLPKTSASFYNCTNIGAWRCANPVVTPAIGHRRGARIRRNSDLKVYNSLFLNYQIGLFIDGVNCYNNSIEDSLAFRNNIVAADFTSYPTHTAAENVITTGSINASRTVFLNPAYGNDSLNIGNTCATGASRVLVNAYNYLAPDYRPNLADLGTITTTNIRSLPNLQPTIAIDNATFTANQTSDFAVFITEAGQGSTNGLMNITIPKVSGWNITVPGITLTGSNQAGTSGTSNVSGGIPNDNSNWLFREDANTIYLTSKVGYILGNGGYSTIGLVATRKATTGINTNQNVAATIQSGSGMDNTPSDNSTFQGFSAN